MGKVTPIKVTTDHTIRVDLLNSLNLVGVAYGTTWGHFCQAVESFGIHRDTPLDSIEVGMMQGGSGRIAIRQEEGYGISIREMSESQVTGHGAS